MDGSQGVAGLRGGLVDQLLLRTVLQAVLLLTSHALAGQADYSIHLVFIFQSLLGDVPSDGSSVGLALVAHLHLGAALS